MTVPVHPPRRSAGTPAGQAPVDGNALAGLLGDVLAVDPTTAVGTCRACGHVAPLADTVVELDDRGAVVRCRGCSRTLLTVLCADGTAAGRPVRLELGCLAALSLG